MTEERYIEPTPASAPLARDMFGAFLLKMLLLTIGLSFGFAAVACAIGAVVGR